MLLSLLRVLKYTRYDGCGSAGVVVFGVTNHDACKSWLSESDVRNAAELLAL